MLILKLFRLSIADEMNTFLIQFTAQSITNPRLMSLDTEIIPHSRQEETNYFLFVEIYLECLLTSHPSPDLPRCGGSASYDLDHV